VRGQKFTTDDAELVVREYKGGSSPEFFISFETKDRKTIFGFCR
jgi:hypothetical protein